MDKNKVLRLVENFRSLDDEEKDFFSGIITSSPVDTLKTEGSWRHSCSVYSDDFIEVSWDRECNPTVSIDSLDCIVCLDSTGVFSMREIFNYLWSEISGEQ